MLEVYQMISTIWYHLQFKKREKNPWRNVTFGKVEGLLY